MRLVECIQGSVEWLKARAGKVTGSRIKDVLAQIKSGEAASRRDYRVELVCEILTGEPTPQGFISRDMEWGTANEPFARGAVEVARGYMVDQVGFVLHPTMDRAGVSPDGLVNWMAGDEAPEGIVEIKCPKTATHLGYILAGVVPSDYHGNGEGADTVVVGAVTVVDELGGDTPGGAVCAHAPAVVVRKNIPASAVRQTSPVRDLAFDSLRIIAGDP